MDPTISNAFNNGSADSTGEKNKAPANRGTARKTQSARNPRKSLAASLAPMQVDLREANFGWSLDLSPMRAIDALQGLLTAATDAGSFQFLVSMEQSAWRDGENDMPIGEIAQRLAISVLHRLSVDQLVMDETSLRQLVSVCQPSRLVAIAIEGVVDERDAEAIDKALNQGRSPLLAELRAVMALEVLGDRSVVLHCRDKATAHGLVADNFRYFLAALNNCPPSAYEAPQTWQIERLLSLTGMLTLRPIETQIFSTSIDVGINTSKERFSQPADRSLVYDIPSNTWHDEP